MLSRVADLVAQLPMGVALALLTTAVIAFLSLLSRAVRQRVFYKRHEFELPYDPEWKATQWDIQWEGFRVTIEVSGVRRAFIKNVVIKVNGTSPGRTFEKMEVSNEFYELERLPLAAKLHSTIRVETSDGKQLYRLFWVLRRRRW